MQEEEVCLISPGNAVRFPVEILRRGTAGWNSSGCTLFSCQTQKQFISCVALTSKCGPMEMRLTFDSRAALHFFFFRYFSGNYKTCQTVQYTSGAVLAAVVAIIRCVLSEFSTKRWNNAQSALTLPCITVHRYGWTAGEGRKGVDKHLQLVENTFLLKVSPLSAEVLTADGKRTARQRPAGNTRPEKLHKFAKSWQNWQKKKKKEKSFKWGEALHRVAFYDHAITRADLAQSTDDAASMWTSNSLPLFGFRPDGTQLSRVNGGLVCTTAWNKHEWRLVPMHYAISGCTKLQMKSRAGNGSDAGPVCHQTSHKTTTLLGWSHWFTGIISDVSSLWR